jgi:hypothetical protein
MKKIFLLVIMALLWANVVPSAEFTSNEFGQFQQACQASLDEPWRTIPWKISLLEAQNLAAKEKKPIFIWAMDGHPLGCT